MSHLFTIGDAINELNDKIATIPKALSDLTDDETHRVVTDAEKAAWNAQANIIEIVKVNGTALAPSNKAVDITVPTEAQIKTIAATEINTIVGGVSSTDTIENITTLVNYVNEHGADTAALVSEVYGSSETTDTSRIDTLETNVATLNGANTVEGSVAKAVKDGIDALYNDLLWNGDTDITVAAAENALRADRDGSNEVITDTYETKTDATTKLTEAKSYADSVVSTHNSNTASHADIRQTISQLSSEKVNSTQLTTAVESALAQAKASGEFDGKDGKSAYEYAQDGGYTGTEEEFLQALAEIDDIEIPTKVSELTNDSKFITKSDIPTASGTVAGITVVYPAASCTTFSSDSGTVTPLAVQKGAKQFAITRPSSTTNKAITRYSNTTGDVQDSKIVIEDVTNSKDSSKKAQVIAVPAEGGKKMVYGYCTDQVDGTSFIGGLFNESDTSYPYQGGLAIGGSSGNLLWKGDKVITASDLVAKVDKTYIISVFEELKTAIEESDLNATVAILDRAILDLSKLA